MQLYSGPLSLFTAKVRIALAEKGLAYDRIEVAWSLAHRYEPHHPEVVRLNPKRQVPVLVDGDVALYDSTVILEYLEDRHPEPPLYPREPAARARCRRLELEADELLFPHVWGLIETGFYPAEEADAGRAAAARAGVAAFHLRLEKELGEDAHLCGAFGVADLANYVMLNAAATLGAPVAASHPTLQSWLARVGARPAVHREQEAMAAFAREAFAGRG